MLLSGQHVAFTNPPMLAQLKIGSRVAARFHEGKQSWFFSAIVAELPDRKNRMRFLVFYDDGSVAYVTLPDMHLVYKPLENVWEDIEDLKQRKTVEEFLHKNYTPTVLVLHQGEQLQVMRDGQWQDARITTVDSSLVKVEFTDEHSEWLYKGSERLVYVYRIRKRAEESKGKEKTLSFSKPPPKPHTPSTTVVLSTSTTTTTTTTTTTSTTATKTISSQQNSTPVLSKAAVTKVSESVPKEASDKMQPKVVLEKLSLTDIISVQTQRNSASPQALLSSPSPAARPSQQGVQQPQPPLALDSPIIRDGRLMYNPHRCCPACLDDYRPSGSNIHCGRNPLDIPLHHGFRRITGRYRTDSKVLFHVYYRSPCGRSLSTMGHLQDFLFQTRCDFLFLDMFCLDPYVLVKRAVPPGQPQACFSLPDISQGKESVPIPCFSQFDNTRPPLVEYIAKRKPAKGVCINTQTDFLVGCDCTDGCLDRSKCSCHQLTVEATALYSSGPLDTSAGYTHKRLLAPLPTGVYECNPLCRCDPRMCCNRVVQHGPQLRLQLFMTQHKGWGIRCLDDVAKGTFVCTFSGEVMTDDMANSEGKVLGDEYFANLDYIEGVEALKEGYESSAYCSEGEDASNEKVSNSQPKAAGDQIKDGQVLVDSDFSEAVGHNDDDDNDDEGVSDERGSDDSYVASDVDVDITMQRSYITRRNAKMLKVSVEVNSLDGPRPGFAVKSTHRKVKPGNVTTKPADSKKVSPSRNTTRRLFDGEDSCYIISAGKQGNLGRYLNHSCDPNLFVQNVFVDTHDLRFPWVAYFTRKRIRAGTELTWDYNYEVGSVEGKLVLCCCGSDRCTGRLL